jgi:hypothetical protein
MTDLRRLVCNCAVRLVDEDGVIKTVRSRRWDCPSCGRDKANKIREMCVVAGSYRMFTLTFDQPLYTPESSPPERHRNCHPSSHVYTYRDGTERWRMLETCSHCCAYAAWCWSKFRKAMRRQWPTFEGLQLKEIQPKSGSFTINLAVIGLPPFPVKSRAARRVRAMWVQSGGGRMHLGFQSPKNSPGALGRYIGKYLTKLAHRPLAKGYRRWTRTRGFAPDVVMTDPRTPTGLRHDWLGFVHPDSLEVLPHGLRWYPPD